MRSLWPPLSVTTQIGGYGSRIGARCRSLVRDDVEFIQTAIEAVIAAKRSNPSRKNGLLRFARHDVAPHDSAIPRREVRPGRCRNLVPRKERGRRESRVPNAPAASRAKVKSTRVSRYRFTGNIPAFPAQWFTAYGALSPVNGLFCHRRLRVTTRRLNSSVAESGPHDFAVRFSATRQRHLHVHRIPPRVS